MLPLPPKPVFSETSSYWLNARAIVQAMRAKAVPNPLTIAVLANADMESAFTTSAVGDHDTAFNLWQWHWSPRGERIFAGTGIDVRKERDIAKVVEALWWEMTSVGPYISAFNQMLRATSGEDAAGIFCAVIEGAGAADAKARRMADAEWWSVALTKYATFFDVVFSS